MHKARERTPVALGTFAALSYRSCRLWFYGQMVSLFGKPQPASAAFLERG